MKNYSSSSISNNRNAKSAVSELIDIMDLGCRINHKPHELSGGEKQRVAIARSLVNSPLILADEPTGNLDEDTSKHVEIIYSAIHNFSKSIILVTHSKYVANYTIKNMIDEWYTSLIFRKNNMKVFISGKLYDEKSFNFCF